MLERLGSYYRKAMPAVIAAYGAWVVFVVLAFELAGWSEPVRATVAAVTVCLAGIPLEQLGNRWRRLMPFMVALYVASFIVTFFLMNVRLSIEWVAILLIGAAFVTGKIKTFAKDWAVFIVVVIAWQVTDGLAGAFHFPLHIRAMIDADKFMFGAVPSVWLQQHLFHADRIMWYDVMGVMVYSLHFLLPLTAGFVLWLVNRRLYYMYAICFVIAALAGFATYVVFPAVPPWMAVMHCPNNGSWACDAGHYQHFLPWFKEYAAGIQQLVDSGRMTIRIAARQTWVPGIHDVWNHTMAGWVSKNHGNVGFGGFRFGFDQVGAVPSEHTMYPWLVFLFLRRQFGRTAYLMAGWVCLVIFSIVYMGQHYVIDGIIGIAYASIVYALVMHLAPWVWGHLRRRRPVQISVPVLPLTEAAASRTDDRIPVEASERAF